MKKRDSAPGLMLSERLYQALLFVLPREFRRQYGEDTLELFRDLYRNAFERSGATGALFVGIKSVVHLLECAARERLSGLRGARVVTGPQRRFPRLVELTQHVAQDVRFATRSYTKRPGFALTAILIVAVGVGATTTIFSVVDGVLLRKLPYPEPNRLYFFDHGSHSPLDLVDFRDRTTSFSSVAGGWDRDVDLTGAGEPIKLRGATVTAGFFELLGAQPLLGRLFVGDDYVGEPRVTVLSHGLWRRRFGGDVNVLGRQITLDGQPLTVVGVLSPQFRSPEVLVGSDVQVWYPFDPATPRFQDRGWHILGIAARLKDGVVEQTAQAELDVLAEALFREIPDSRRYRDGSMIPIEILPLHEVTVGQIDTTLYMLLGAVGLMLLIACANLANLFLARGTDRSREIALRAALGAGRGRIVGQLLSEAVFIALIGGALGVAIAYAGVAAFDWYNPGDIPRADNVAVDSRILVFALLVSAGTGVLFGIFPAVSAARSDVNKELKEGTANTTTRRGKVSLRSSLVVAEIAMALVLLSGAGLLFNSFLRLQRVDPGFETEQIVTLPLHLGPTFSPSERVEFTRDLLDRLESTPGIEGATAGVLLPFVIHGGSRCCWRTSVEPIPLEPREEELLTIVHPVAPGYFQLLGARLISGRGFRDDAGSASEGVVNESLARRMFGDTDVVGRAFLVPSAPVHRNRQGDTEITIVGVVDEIRHWGQAEEVDDQLYVSYAEYGGGFLRLHVAVKSGLPLATVAQLLRSAVWELQPNLPIGVVTTMRQRVANSVAQPRFYTMLLIGFATVAILLAAGGIYGSMLYSVGQRQREVGIRLAVGAQSRHVLGLIVGHGMLLAAVGIALGVAGAVALSRVLESMVFGITTTDPTTFASVAVLLAVVAFAACYAPARRASRTDPMETLRSE